MKRSVDGIGMTSLRTRRRLVARLREEGIANEAVLDALEQTPRHLFLDEALASRAYDDTALPIGFNQTISQPYVVARMTEALLEPGPCARVLEIGTGSGYQTAVLARLVERVYTMERIQALVHEARKRLHRIGLRNISFTHGDGAVGLPEHAPFDGILVTAAPSGVPEALVEQLATGGCIVIPVGEGTQRLLRLVRDEKGISEETLEMVRFVPLVSGVV